MRIDVSRACMYNAFIAFHLSSLWGLVMALKGNLRDFTITQLLNLVNLAAKTGTLVIESSGGVSRIVFREGKLAYAQIGNEDESLPAILHRSQKITRNQYNILKQRAGQMTDKELGILLINAGYVSQEDILVSLQEYFANVVQRLFACVDGNFRFETEEMPPDGKIPVKIDLENLIIEGSRQLQEWEQLQEEIPSLDMALKFTDRPGANLRKINLSVEEWQVVSYVNPKNSIRQIAQTIKMNDLQIRQVVYGLLQAGLVEVIRTSGQTQLVPGKMFPTPDRDEQKTLVKKLIGRIRSL